MFIGIIQFSVGRTLLQIRFNFQNILSFGSGKGTKLYFFIAQLFATTVASLASLFEFESLSLLVIVT